MPSTVHWSPSESSLLRGSLNSTLTHKEFDVPGSLMVDGSMGRAAEMGEGWVPGGIAARQAVALVTLQNKSGNLGLVITSPMTSPKAEQGTARSQVMTRSPTLQRTGSAASKTEWGSMLGPVTRGPLVSQTDIEDLKKRHL
mmetsp:Transcript_65314/g.115915  ORF Transcript_65314/g.115915 Transcript_65314/m.115915 type:complete len:141 (-) Transcript_65314:45-467(-)